MIVTALIVAGLVAAAFFLPARFMDVLWGNNATAPAATAALAEVRPAPAKPALAATMKPQAVKAASAPAPASKPAAPATPKAEGDLVTNTFQTIFAGPNGPSLEASAPSDRPGAALTAALPATTSAPKPTPAEGKGVVTRLVDTLVIHANPKTGAIEMPALTSGDEVVPPVPAEPDAKTSTSAATQPTKSAPVAAAPAEAPAPDEAAPVPLAPPPALAGRPATPPPSIVASAKAAPATPVKPAATKPAAAPTASEYAIVGGKGVSVRSGPGTAHNALFTLAAGKKVAVSDKEHGWLHITDAEGRSGWLYSGLVEITKD